LALAGNESLIPFDEVVDSMATVGRLRRENWKRKFSDKEKRIVPLFFIARNEEKTSKYIEK